MSGSIWECLGVFGSVWEYPGVSGSIRECLEVSGSVWQYPGVSGVPAEGRVSRYQWSPRPPAPARSGWTRPIGSVRVACRPLPPHRWRQTDNGGPSATSVR